MWSCGDPSLTDTRVAVSLYSGYRWWWPSDWDGQNAGRGGPPQFVMTRTPEGVWTGIDPREPDPKNLPSGLESASERFNRLLKEVIAPEFRHLGFKGSGVGSAS